MDDDERSRVRDLCSDPHFRIAAAVLAEQDRSLTLNDLTKAVVKHDYGTSITEIDGDEVTTIERALEERLVPALADLELVEIDEERELVEPGERFEALQPVVADVVADDPELELPLEL